MSVPKEKPKASPKVLVKNNWFIIKLLFKSYPLGVSLMALEKLRHSVFVFIEHTWLINYVLESVEYGRPFKNVLTAALTVVALIAITTILDTAAWNRFEPKVNLKARANLKNIIYEKAHQVDLEKFDNPEYYNDFVLTVEKADMIISRGLRLIYSVAESLGGFITTGVFFFTKDIYAFVIVLIASFVNLYFNLSRSKLWYKKSVEAQPKYRKADYTKRLFYLSDYAKELRLNPDLKDEAFVTYDESYDELISTLKFYDKKILFNGIFSDLLSFIIMDLILVLSLVYQASVLKSISYALVVVIINSAYRFRWDISRLIVTITNTAESCMYVDKIKAFLKEKEKIVSTENKSVDNEPKEITLKNVSFAYNETDGEILKDISLTVKPKEKIALVGYNGAGKTTLVKLLMRLYDPTSGVILQNGVDIKEFDVEKYRKSIGVIFQDFNIYSATLKENVVMDICDNTEDELIEKSLNLSGFGDKLSELKDGVQTILTTEFDDDGVNLSGGEAQKVAVSRAFFKKSGLIILDEPSSALDPIAEYNLNKYMLSAAKDSTVVFISHRLSTTRIADKIYMLENGRIIESGSHEQLLDQNGKYAQMWYAQASRYAD